MSTPPLSEQPFTAVLFALVEAQSQLLFEIGKTATDPAVMRKILAMSRRVRAAITPYLALPVAQNDQRDDAEFPFGMVAGFDATPPETYEELFPYR